MHKMYVEKPFFHFNIFQCWCFKQITKCILESQLQ